MFVLSHKNDAKVPYFVMHEVSYLQLALNLQRFESCYFSLNHVHIILKLHSPFTFIKAVITVIYLFKGNLKSSSDDKNMKIFISKEVTQRSKLLKQIHKKGGNCFLENL